MLHGVAGQCVPQYILLLTGRLNGCMDFMVRSTMHKPHAA